MQGEKNGMAVTDFLTSKRGFLSNFIVDASIWRKLHDMCFYF